MAQNDRHENVNNRFDPDPQILDSSQRGVFHANSGELRSFRLPLRVRDVRRVVWFCLGEGSPIRRLLSHEKSGVQYLGKKGSIGYGQVAKWTVEHVEHDWSWFAPSPAGEVLMRALPKSMRLPTGLAGYRNWFGGVVAPYWSAKYHTEIVEPC
jgi:CRISPR type IV-associated protein Csf3